MAGSGFAEAVPAPKVRFTTGSPRLPLQVCAMLKVWDMIIMKRVQKENLKYFKTQLEKFNRDAGVNVTDK